MTEALVVEFDVTASPGHAFRTWAEATTLWWPRSHTVSGERDLSIVFEPFAGGRVYEQSPDGAEHEWGSVTAWEPPTRLAYRWHLFFDPSEATDVEITFTPVAGGTRVRLEQTGWERLGAAGAVRRRRTEQAWSSIVGVYREALG